MYDSISKIGKSIAKCKSLSGKPSGAEIDMIDLGKGINKEFVNEIISKHLFVSGRFDSGEKFCEESGVELEEEFKDNFRALDLILTEINLKKLDKVFQWIKENDSKLKISESDVPFLAHKAQF
mmetsp:Transcript_366/g.325  ORF Transcript_366/g.325 Transcript_366/m.325 type:complete len:123 (+) Transcript_366:274-642(+)